MLHGVAHGFCLYYVTPVIVGPHFSQRLHILGTLNSPTTSASTSVQNQNSVVHNRQTLANREHSSSSMKIISGERKTNRSVIFFLLIASAINHLTTDDAF